jgi:phosphonopyruvate decarboxylase
MRLPDAVKVISAARGDRVAIATMSAMTALADVSQSKADLCYFSPMGSASSLGLGLAMARPDIGVLVLDGDGCLLMNLGTLVTIANQAPANLVHVVFENGCYALSGMQPLPMKSTANLAGIAEEAGFPSVFAISDLEDLSDSIADILTAPGPVFVNLKVEAEPVSLARMTTPEYRDRTAREGWHNLHKLLAGSDTAGG